MLPRATSTDYPPKGIVRLIAAEDSKVVEAVAQQVPQIVQAAEMITAALKDGGA